MKFGASVMGPGITALFLSIAGIAAGAATRQTASAPPAESSAAGELSPGTTICVALTKTIDAKSAKPGDAIVARVTLPVLAKGKVVLPNDSKITGHVVSAKPRSENDESEVSIVFDHAVTKDGSGMVLPLTVQAIGKSEYTAEEFSDPGGPPALGSPSRTAPGSAGGPPVFPPPMTRDTSNSAPTNPEAPDAPHAALDTGSHGAVGLPNLKLTESADATSGSVIKATKKNVKLDTGMEMVLRVVEPVKADKQAGQN